ncbi:MAG TPA: CDP-archaeol synthase [Crocinitomicaceae bacterium]|jgi:phosphatidate cytidylyltransferase|nr:CDP-archaeol synthase [Crocinitomicaceae bacterium]
MKDIVLRSISGFVFVAILVASIVLWDGVCVKYVLGLFSGLALYEFYQMLKVKNIHLSPFTFIGAGLGIYIFLFLDSLEPVIIAILLIFWLIELWRKKGNSLEIIAYGTFGLIYCVFPFVLMVLFHEISQKTSILLYLFIIVWTNDTFAYLTGRAFGKHKLFERISPKKTWEGTIGGIVASLLVGFLIYYFLERSFPKVLFFGGVFFMAVGAILGDLFESLIKRSLGVKDSGNIIPGHGGILDRFDAAMFAAPLLLVYIIFFNLFS